MAPYAYPNIHPAFHPQRQPHPSHHQHHHHHPQQQRLPAPPPRQAQPHPPPPPHRRAHSSPNLPPGGVASYYRLYTLPPHHPPPRAAPPPWSPDPGPGAIYVPVVPSHAEIAMAQRMHAAGEQMRQQTAHADAARTAGAVMAMTPRSHGPPPASGIYGWAACGCPLVEGLVPRRGPPRGGGQGMVPWGGARGPVARREQHQGDRYIRGTYDGMPERRRRTSAPAPRLAFRRTPVPARASRAHFATARQHWIGGEGEAGYFTSEGEEETEDDDSLATWEVYGDYDGVPYYEEGEEGDDDDEDDEDDESSGWGFMGDRYVRPEVVYRSVCGCCA